MIDHFTDINKMVQIGSGAERKQQDYELTRYACYLIAQNLKSCTHDGSGSIMCNYNFSEY